MVKFSFPAKGLVHGFGQKCETFSSSLSRLNIPKKVIHNVPDKKLAFLEDKNVEFKKRQNLLFCKGVIVHGSGEKFAIFSFSCFLDQIHLKKSFMMF